MPAFGYVEVASSLHDATAVERITREVRAEIERAGGVRRSTPEEAPQEPFAVLVATGGTEAAILEVVAARQLVEPAEPVLLLAHPLHNSLPAALGATAKVQHDGGRGRVVQVVPNDGAAAAALTSAVGDVAAPTTPSRVRRRRWW